MGGSRSPGGHRRVLVIGLDGATWSLFEPWMAQGLLPNLRSLCERGAWGDLLSTTPPLTAPAWITFQTGVTPGQHGVTDFSVRRPGSYQTDLLSRMDIALPSLWHILSEAKKRVIVMNVPITYPPEPVNGLLISGLMTPSTSVQFTHPPELADELLSEVGEYPLFTPLRRVDVMGARAFVDRLIDTIERRAAAARYLMSRYPWDFSMVHFQATDVIQHALYPYLDPHHPLHGRTERGDREYVMRFYQVLDQLVGQILDDAGPESTMIVMSDHGFGCVSRRIYLNRLLAREGLLELRGGNLGLQSVAVLESVIRKLDVFRLRRRMAAQGAGDRLATRARGLGMVDWARSRAFAMPGFVYGLVYVNLRGREPQGTVDEAEYELAREHIARTLLSAEDPEGGGNLFAEVLRREDVYHGESLQLMPDLIAVPAHEYMISETFRGNNVVDDAPSMLAGTHRPNGLLVIAGPGIRSGERMETGSIGDLAPTLLHTLGVPIPEHMDGKVLTQAFVPAYLDAYPLSAQGAMADLDRSSTQAYSSSEQAAVEKRLRDLGYMG